MFYTLLDKKAPNFTTQCFHNNEIKEVDFLSEKQRDIALLIFYPADFTPVCTSELITISKMHEEFDKRDVRVFFVSTDSVFTHRAFAEKLGGVYYPMLSDVSKSICRSYNTLNEETSMPFRSHYLIDGKNKVRAFAMQEVGRSTTELLRLIDAVKYIDATGDKCLCNWDADNQ